MKVRLHSVLAVTMLNVTREFWNHAISNRIVITDHYDYEYKMICYSALCVQEEKPKKKKAKVEPKKDAKKADKKPAPKKKGNFLFLFSSTKFDISETS